MKYLALAFLVGFMFAQQEPPEYPDGVSCSPAGTMAGGKVINPSPDHRCSCKRMDADPLCEGEPSHESDCLQWCHEDKNHCSCPVVCDGKSHGAMTGMSH